MQSKRTHPGIVVRHSRFCPSLDGGDCSAGRKDGCEPSYRAWVYDKKSSQKHQRTFQTLSAAKAWREDARSLQRRGKLAAPSRRTLTEVVDEWLAGAKASPPTVLNKSEQPYKPSALRGYESDLKRYVLDDLGAVRLTEIRRADIQKLVDGLRGKSLGASKVHNVVVAVRVTFRYAIERDYCEANPTTGLRLGNGIGHRDRAAKADEAAELLAALPIEQRALWATAFYAGLRRGELRAIRWNDIDLAKGIISVRRSWDDIEGEIEPKSRKGTRTVPIVALLRDHLTDLKARSGHDGPDFVFGAAADRPFTPNNVRRHALKAWDAANKKRAEENEKRDDEKKLQPLVPIGLHECRHTFVSLLYDAGLSLERIGDYVGHSSTYMTDRYRHLLEGHEEEATRLLDAYLARADTSSRIDQIDADTESKPSSAAEGDPRG